MEILDRLTSQRGLKAKLVCFSTAENHCLILLSKFQRLRFTQRFVLLHLPQNLRLQAKNPPFSRGTRKTFEDEGFVFFPHRPSASTSPLDEHSVKYPSEQAASKSSLRKHGKKLPVTLHLWKPAVKNIGLIISPSDDGWPAEVGALATCLFDLDDGGENLSGVTFHFEACSGFTSLSVECSPPAAPLIASSSSEHRVGLRRKENSLHFWLLQEDK